VPTITGGTIQGSTPVDGTTGTVSGLVASLGSTVATRMYFCVMIDP
jgi:hypothetical protein